MDMYFGGLSYRRAAENVGTYFDRPTTPMSVYNWTRQLSNTANDILIDHKIPTSDEWVADELQVRVGGRKYWLFNVMDSKSRVILAAHLSPDRDLRAAATVMRQARHRSANAPKRVKTDGLRSYQQAIRHAFALDEVKHVVSQGIRSEINNNFSERLQGTFRDRDKTLRGLKNRDSGQVYLDGLVLNYNYFRPHRALDGKSPAEKAGADIPFRSWLEVAEAHRADITGGRKVEEDKMEHDHQLPQTATAPDTGTLGPAQKYELQDNEVLVYHGTTKNFDPNNPGVQGGQVFDFDNDPVFQGFWVTEDLSEAQYYLPGEDSDRVLVYALDKSKSVDWADDFEYLTSEEIEKQELDAILGAEGPDNHVVHYPDTTLRFLGVLDE